jgi:DNA-binding NarL/FixJ family response regulator
MSIRVALVEDNAEFRRRLARYLDGAPGFRCVCACASAEEALRQLPPLAPDVVLMDIQLPGTSGIACTVRLRRLLPATAILMLTVFEDTERVLEALKAGACGYLLKRTAPSQILEAISDVARGGAPMTSEIARKVVESFRGPKRTPDVDPLTGREEAILQSLSKGLLPREAAAELGMTYETLRTHLKHIYDKLHARSRTEAVLKYLDRL